MSTIFPRKLIFTHLKILVDWFLIYFNDVDKNGKKGIDNMEIKSYKTINYFENNIYTH